MGCCEDESTINVNGENNVNNGGNNQEVNNQTNIEEKKVPKAFHEMTEEEKEKIKKEMETQDKDIEQKLERPKTTCENFNWDDMMKKLPIDKTSDERKKRLELWKKLNEYGNGYLSYRRLMVQLTNYLDLPDVLRNKGPIKLAFDAAADYYSRNGVNKNDNLIEWMEFRIFLVYLRQYFEYWVMFQKVDSSGDHKISLDEFKNAVPTMEKWGVEIDNPEREFNNIDVNEEGTVTFDEFCTFAIQKSLDLEDDDGFDDEELKNLK